MNDFVENLHDVFSDFGRLQIRRMFGGCGIYHDGLMFALVASDCLYLKVDPLNRQFFDQRHLAPFEYVKQGRRTQMSYHQAPEELFDDKALAADWAKRSFEAALRAKRRS